MKKVNKLKKENAKMTIAAAESLTAEQMMLINGGTAYDYNETAMNAIRAIR